MDSSCKCIFFLFLLTSNRQSRRSSDKLKESALFICRVRAENLEEKSNGRGVVRVSVVRTTTFNQRLQLPCVVTTATEQLLQLFGREINTISQNLIHNVLTYQFLSSNSQTFGVRIPLTVHFSFTCHICFTKAILRFSACCFQNL